MSDDGGLWLLALGPAGGTALYWAIYRYYRNTDKSHAFERETAADAKPVTGHERKVDTVTETQKQWVDGTSEKTFRRRATHFRYSLR